MPTFKENKCKALDCEQLQNQATNTIGLQCPRCNETSYMKYGKAKGKQRFKCKACGKTFHTDHNTPYYRLRKRENTIKYLKALNEGLSIKKAAKEAGISVKTSFQWRHRFLSSVNEGQPIETGEIVGIKEIALPYSSKGKPTENAGKPSRTLLQISASGQLSLIKLSSDNPTKNAGQILSEIKSANKYIFLQSKLMTSAIRKSGKQKLQITDKKLTHQFITTLESEAQKLEEWMKQFRGVATKYLRQYWGWYTVSSALNNETDENLFARKCVSKRRILMTTAA